MSGGSGDAGIIKVYDNDEQAKVTVDGYGVNAGGEIIVHEADGSRAVELASDSGGKVTVNGADGSAAVKLESFGGKVYVNDASGAMAGVLSGTTSSRGYQYLYTGDGSVGICLDGDSGGAGYISIRNTNSLARVALDGRSGDGGGRVTVDAGDGSIGVDIIGDNNGGGRVPMAAADGSGAVDLLGENSGAGLVVVSDSGGSARIRLDGESVDTGGEISVYDNDGTETVEILGAEGSGQGGQIALWSVAGGAPTVLLDGDFGGDGRVTTEELEITGGSDLSEQFDVAAEHGEVTPGMVVCIDPQEPGKLIVCSETYDRTVAGVVSGAGGGGSPGGTFVLKGMLGQPNAGSTMTGGVFSVTGGYSAWFAIQIEGAPSLRIEPTGSGQATISWDAGDPGWVLQEATSMTLSNWVDSASGPTNPITIRATAPATFYRLSKP